MSLTPSRDVTRPLHTWVSDHFTVPLPPGHPFPIEKYTALRLHLLEHEILSHEEIHRSEPAPMEWIHLAHDEDYVRRTLVGELARNEERRLGIPWSLELVQRARAAVFGTVMAARTAVEHGIAANLAGGTHHAFADRPEGYCLYNDIAVAIRFLRSEGNARRPLIIDLDVHQGNGTAAIFLGDPSVFTFSMHAANNYPLKKESSTIDVGLPDGCDDTLYLEKLGYNLDRLFDAHEPDLVLYQAGVDGLVTDRLGRLGLTHAGLSRRDQMVFASCERYRIPVVVTLGGGYGNPQDETIEAHANVWRNARDARSRRPLDTIPAETE